MTHAATPVAPMAEHFTLPCGENPPDLAGASIFVGEPQPVRAQVALPTGPGLGVSIDPQLLAPL